MNRPLLKRATLCLGSLWLAASLLTACAKNVAQSKKAGPPSQGSVAPAPSGTSAGQTSFLQGSWLQDCLSDETRWSVVVNGNQFTFNGLQYATPDCSDQGQPISGYPWTLTFQLVAPTQSGYQNDIQYLNPDGSLYFQESVTEGTANGRQFLGFSSDSDGPYYQQSGSSVTQLAGQ
jgi:hypothetical protein